MVACSVVLGGLPRTALADAPVADGRVDTWHIGVSGGPFFNDAHSVSAAFAATALYHDHEGVFALGGRARIAFPPTTATEVEVAARIYPHALPLSDYYGLGLGAGLRWFGSEGVRLGFVPSIEVGIAFRITRLVFGVGSRFEMFVSDGVRGSSVYGGPELSLACVLP